jgi:phosphoglycerate dehydrogenase-like enzyme
MAVGKVIFLTRTIEPEAQDVFLQEAPTGWQVTVVEPNQGAQVVEQIEDADVLVTYRSGRVPESILPHAKQLKLIQVMGQGTDHIPVRAAREKGIHVANTGGANALAVAELAVLLMLATLRRILTNSEALRAGRFQAEIDNRYAHQLYEKTVGIVGFGNIGRRVAKLVHGFGAHILFFEQMDIPQALAADLHARSVSLEDLLARADIMSLHVPLLPSTRRMIGWEQLTMMKPTAYVINTSRGAVVDEAALVRALKEKRIAGAGIDVFDPEPPDPKNPLLHMDNVVATPHMGATSWENWELRVKNVWNNVQRVWEGEEPKNQVREF